MGTHEHVSQLRCMSQSSSLMTFRSLRNKLPFDDDEFDHVHIQGLALGIPENKVRECRHHDIIGETY